MPTQAMPTTYGGITYRSRCEARWAVVFDKLGWTHHYELEGFRLSTGPYLPDFYLPDIGVYFEVKASPPSHNECKKAEALCTASGTPVVISTSPPNPNRDEIDHDLVVFYPELIDGETVAFQYDGSFMSGRFSFQPSCSLHLGNLSYLGSLTEVSWRDAFRAAANERFGIYANLRATNPNE